MEESVVTTEPGQVTRQEIRQRILDFENTLAQLPNALFGDNDRCPLRHSFGDGMYVREIFIPRGMVCTGKIHKYTHPNFLLQGEVLVYTEHDGIQHLKAPLALMSKAGTKRVVIALQDTWWVTVHATEETDLEKIEQHVIAKNYEAFEQHKLLGVNP